jgi:mannose-6-phosphate isomerase-like protein (cupin superfamily)
MLPKAKYDYILMWNEDHLNLAPQNLYAGIAAEMKLQKIDYMLYSWWQFGDSVERYKLLDIDKFKYIDTVYLTKNKWKKLIKAGHPYGIISSMGIFHKDFFKKLLLKDKVKLPIFFTKNLYRIMTLLNYIGLRFNQRECFNIINRILFHKLRKFPKETPFDVEKAADRTDVLPIKMGLARQELFACIDDDLGVKVKGYKIFDGYQLIKRGLYPPRTMLQTDKGIKQIIPWGEKEILEKNNDYTIERCFMSKNGSSSERYYENEIRTKTLMRKTVIVMNGKLLVEVKGRQLELTPGQSITIFPNIGFNLKAIEDSLFIAIFSSIHNKKIKYANPNQ